MSLPRRQPRRIEARVTRALETVLGLGLIAMVLVNVVNAAGVTAGYPR